MKSKILIISIIAFCGILTLTAAKKEKDEIVLKDGRVLKNPYIISRTPSGLNVGHENGVIFVPFSKMSEERQKQFDYDPKKSKKHKKKIAKAQKRRQVRLAKKEEQGNKSSGSFFTYGPERFPDPSTKSSLENELASLIREKARLEREYSRVNAGRISPQSGPSDDVYVSYRGGKVYRKKRPNYGKKHMKNSLDKRKRLKEISGQIQRNQRRTTTVRNLIKRQTSKGINVGKTMDTY
jgi:hypothetical protein